MAKMTFRKVMQDLKAAGTPQNRQLNATHGVGEKQFGVSAEHLDKLQKRLKVDHKLALKLWATGNHDARMLAARIADPALLTSAEIDAWVKDLDNDLLAGALAALVARSPLARKKMDKWIKAKKVYVGQAGWDVLCGLAMQPGAISDEELAPYLQQIESGIQSAKDRVKHAMNMALISIGVHSQPLRQAALEVARRIGTVVVDHGQMNYRTPDAATYIMRAAQYQRRHAQQPAS